MPSISQSEKQMHNHQKSKAHRKMVESLKSEFGDDVLDGIQESPREDDDEEEEDEVGGGDPDGKEQEAAKDAYLFEQPDTVPAESTNNGVADGSEAAEEGLDHNGDVEEEEEEESSSDDDTSFITQRVNRFALDEASSEDDDG